ncbi:hypothetical protein [Sinomonas cyclohexanicum]|uniref:hypothetical protein n=1 Tax=Sinomonas cyclohexanicum TaxID=322009 RepID=UPI001E2F59FF|nr:hypothetical protein [Corynebacterium cyclohexanicum]
MEAGAGGAGRPVGLLGRASILALVGGLAFWLANLAISLTPVAAEYRAALGIAYVPMLIEALLGGLIVGFIVGYSMLRLFGRIPTGGPLTKSLVLTTVVLVVATLALEAPTKFLTALSEPWRYFIIGTVFNVIRFVALAVAVGSLYGRVDPRRTRTARPR